MRGNVSAAQIQSGRGTAVQLPLHSCERAAGELLTSSATFISRGNPTSRLLQ